MGKTDTLGAWMWASESATLQTPALEDGSEVYAQRVQVGGTPAFYSFTVKLSENPGRLRIVLAPGAKAAGKPINIYYDGLVLAEGEFLPGLTPSFLDPEGRQGRWGDQPFSNLIRNASAERAWFRLRPQVERIISLQTPIFSPAILAFLDDWQGAGWYFQETARYLLQTFWGDFGWGHIRLAGSQTNTILAIFSLAGFLGGLILLIRRWRAIPKEISLFLMATFLPIWVITFFQGIGSLSGTIFIPSARYAFPAIIPTVLLLTAGWLEILRPLRLWKPAGPRIRMALFLVFYLGLDILSIWSIVQYYV